jgi:hypothetical protein
MKTRIIFVLFIVLTFTACATNRVKPEPFIVNRNSPKIAIGEIETQYAETLSITGLKKYTLAVSYYPVEDAVCIQYKNGIPTYNQFWSRDGRDAFKEALARYNEDFEARNLPVRRSKTMNRAYGIVQGYLIWQTLSFTTLCYTNTNVEIGYDFYQRTPYFTTNQRETEFIDPISPQDVFVGEAVVFHFTRAQAEELIKLFDQAFLDSLVLGSGIRINNTGIDTDEY